MYPQEVKFDSRTSLYLDQLSRLREKFPSILLKQYRYYAIKITYTYA